MKMKVDWSKKVSPWDRLGPEMVGRIRVAAAEGVVSPRVCDDCGRVFGSAAGLGAHRALRRGGRSCCI
jgi:hypothetical protein